MTAAGEPRVSVLLLTRDGMATLPAVLDQLAAQRTDFAVEVVAVDSGSRDGTAELLAQRVDRVLTIAPREFDHGATRNLGVEACRGELVVLLVQDALPVGIDWLAQLTAPLFADPTLAGTYARQQPRPEASALTRFYLDGWVATANEPRVQAVADAAAFAALSPYERLAVCTFDDVCSCIRRAAWRAIPFRPTPIAEDVEWARDVLLAGWRLRYTPEAVVIHSHERSARHELRRTRESHARLAALFGLRTIPTAGALLRAWAGALRTHLRVTARQPRELPRALALAVALPLGQYLGGREAA
ncbi:MAG TPA: glycosyltransferase [Thermoanaerobaculia bacterium]|nr:glycosyltransferase [Thermoanaerobaculia bacterium]